MRPRRSRDSDDAVATPMGTAWPLRRICLQAQSRESPAGTPIRRACVSHRMRLEPGVFLGHRLGGQALDGLTLTYYEYASCSSLPFHEHEYAYASFPVLGGYEEHCHRDAHLCWAGRGVF